MLLVRRAAYGLPATSPAARITRTRGVKIHYLGTRYDSRSHDRCDDYVRGIRASHLANKKEGYVDIAYSAVVCEHGTVYEGRGPHRKTGANGNSTLNGAHYAVCALLGSSGLTTPPTAMLGGLRDAIDWLRDAGDAGHEIRGHKDGHATACPGAALYAWVKNGAPRPTADGGTYTVREGDTLWAIAAAQLGDGTRWKEISTLNRLRRPDDLTPGQKIKLPKK